MLWCVFALGTALSVATGDALTKKFFGRFSPLEMAIAASLYSLPFLLAAFPFIPIPELGQGFWWLVLIVIESEIKNRLFASFLMLLGVVIITLFG
jgi:hypothetical protein